MAKTAGAATHQSAKGGLPSAESIVGHHVCIGGLRPYKTCCTNEGN